MGIEAEYIAKTKCSLICIDERDLQVPSMRSGIKIDMLTTSTRRLRFAANTTAIRLLHHSEANRAGQLLLAVESGVRLPDKPLTTREVCRSQPV